ncbi:MAG: hypothetical protein F6K23_39585, partial [Okeania sp. SIO2C9]|uniref:hypothetical protein n=1 Tax=Okeania sp. SIO2C9 TaxID=2607791 RepID=UPI0013C08845
MPAITKVFNQHISTQQELSSAIARAMELAGYGVSEPVNESGNVNYYYPLALSSVEYTLDLLLEVKSNLCVRQRLVKDRLTTALFSPWSDVDKTGEAFYQFVCCNHPEFRIVSISKGSDNPFLLGAIRPENKESWWDEKKYPFYFFAEDNDAAPYFRSFEGNLSPFKSTSTEDYEITSFGYLKYANPYTKKRDCITGLFIVDRDGQQGVCGSFSQELGRVAADGLESGNLLIENTESMFMLLG